MNIIDQPKKKTLSKNLLSMKFMKNKEEADKRTAKENEILQDAHWVAPGLENRGGISLEDQIIFSRRTGRRSFGNFNPQIEKLYKEKNQEEKLTSSSSITKDIELEKGTITEEEMLERFFIYIFYIIYILFSF
jgi:U3 small nucleolar RNA-associated protein 14